MSQKTNLNINPYYDDFDASKNFLKVLFKPGYPVQTRELTTLQSILQNQVENFGTHIFKEGSVVIPGNISYDGQFYAIKVNTTQFGTDISLYIDKFVGKTITKWNKQSIISLILGVIIAVSFTYISPASENNNLLFVFFCGIIGISGMMLPGLSGSFILILLGNYELLLVKAVTDLNILLLSVFFAGSVFGVLSFSHLLSWLLKKYKDQTIALLTGFIAGSLAIIWPWKEVSKSIIISGKEKIIEYDLYFPTEINNENFIATSMIILGVISVYAIEKYSEVK